MNEDQKNRVLSEQELEELMERAIVRAFVKIGLDVDKPFEVQRDFQFVRDLRTTSESIKGKTIITALGVILIGALGIFWLGLKALLGSN
jgi:hypothetical protein